MVILLNKPATRYQKGDYIVYEYGGTQCPVIVVLAEEILEKKGNVLTIEVEVFRGKERKHWIQVVTDTPENQKNGIVDELYEIIEGEKIRLENDDNNAVRELYRWVIPPEGERLSKAVLVQKRLVLPGRYYVTAQCARHMEQINGRPVRVERCLSGEFLWTNISVSMVDTQNQEIIYYMKVMKWGNKQRNSRKKSFGGLTSNGG
jgi:hypothetical protein